jgi:hypothetical protein
MFLTRFRRPSLFLSILVAVFAVALSFSVAPSSVAHAASASSQVVHPNACTFRLTSTVSVVVGGGNESGPTTFGYFNIGKWTDGCGSEYGTVSYSGTTSSWYSFSVSVYIQGLTTAYSNNPYVGAQTFVVVSNRPVCAGGAIQFSAPAGGGGGGGCTPK